jgi:hypothetical protein
MFETPFYVRTPGAPPLLASPWSQLSVVVWLWSLLVLASSTQIVLVLQLSRFSGHWTGHSRIRWTLQQEGLSVCLKDLKKI